MKKILAAVVLAPILAFAGFKGYVWYKVRGFMEDVVVVAQPIARVTYGGISTSLSGTMSVNDVRISNPAQGLNVTMERIGLTAPDLQTLLNLDDEIKSGRVPKKLRYSIDHMRIPFITVSFFDAGEGSFDSFYERGAALGCVDVERLGLESMSELGYTDVDASIDLAFRRNDVGGFLDVTFTMEWHNAVRYVMSAEIPGGDSLGGLASADSMRSVSLDIEDLGLNRRVINYCSKKAGIEPEAYIDENLRLSKAYFEDAGIHLSDSLYLAMRNYLTRGDSLGISVQPDDPTIFQRIGMHKPSSYPALLGIEVTSGGKAIDYAFDFDSRKYRAALAKTRQDDQATVQTPRKSKPPPKAYVEVDKQQLGRYLNGFVKVTTASGRTLEGRLLESNNVSIQVRVKLSSGVATLPIRLSDITIAKVYR